ncbi:MAG: ArsA family ATPase [Deltaproteobacteria bacterium]|nr:MAG: ArsA family ATPase [Deltaproteobacteria bacterium]
MSNGETGFVADVLDTARLIVCIGTGGVGKTTTSAALALRAAQRGRRVLVMTIDPAKRLANAMGLEALGNEPEAVRMPPDTKGSLDAMMLDARRTFDDLIRRTAGDEAPSILENRVYRLMVDRLSGTQEYMALERLYDLYSSGRWDLVVLDTPPSTNALEFFDAPRRTANMFDERVMRWFLPEHRSDAGLLRRVFNPGAVVLRLLAIVGGEQFVSELSEFFGALRIVRASFEERGHEVRRILGDRDTRYVLIASPDTRRVDEALLLRRKLAEERRTIDLYILNRSHHLFEADDLERVTRDSGTTEPMPGAFSRWYPRLVQLAERDRAGVQRLRSGLSPRDVIRLVPAFDRPIHSLTELQGIGGFLLDEPLPTGNDPGQPA